VAVDGVWRCTPACLATALRVVRAGPTVPCSSMATSVMRCRVAAISAPVSPRRTGYTTKHGFLSLGVSARLPPASSRQLPISSFEEWHSVAFGVEAVDLDLVAADHEVRVDVGAVDAHAP
jgi:hypothetical protein